MELEEIKPELPTMKSNYKMYYLIGAGVIILIVVIYLLWTRSAPQQTQSVQQAPPPQPPPQPTPIPENTEAKDIAQTLENEFEEEPEKEEVIN